MAVTFPACRRSHSRIASSLLSIGVKVFRPAITSWFICWSLAKAGGTESIWLMVLARALVFGMYGLAGMFVVKCAVPRLPPLV